MPKVKFGFKNAYYAKITESEGSVSYGTPTRLPGAVSMTIAPVGEEAEFYADDGLYFSDNVNNGYDGSLELAMIPDAFRKDILGEIEDDNHVLVETAATTSNPFALLCEFTTDNGARKFAFYHCTAKRANQEATTKSAAKEVKTETLELKIRPRYDNLVKVTTTETATTASTGWYSTVYSPTISA